MQADPAQALPDSNAQARYRFADVEFDEIEGKLRVAGRPVVIEPRPLRLLLELLRHVNEVVTKEELLDNVWEGRPTVDHVLANAVSKLRTALGEQGAARLMTVPRVGYRLLGPVQRLAARAVECVLRAGEPVPGREAYLLERALGEGAHSDVWLARHAKLGQSHVFKFASDGPRLAALKREYTLYRVLAHELGPRDDLAVVLDTNFQSAPYFIECEFGGQSLLEWAGADPGRLAGMPVQARLDLFLQTARAVAAAHSVGVLHKDLKPGNILIQAGADAVGPDVTTAPDRSGTAGTRAPQPTRWQTRLTDFGSGRLLDPERLEGMHLTGLGLTQAQSAGADSHSGTLQYMAPELVAGQPATVQSDVYALGVLLHQWLVGDFRRPLATGWARDVADPLLADDIAAATEGQPAKRLASAAELVERLSGLQARHRAQQAQAEQAARTAAALAELQRRNARRPWLVVASVCLGLGLLASLYFQGRMQTALQAAQQASQRSSAINDFLARDLLVVADAFSDGSSRQTTVLELLTQAVAKLPDTFKGQPRTEAEVRHHLGRAFERLTNYGEASRQYNAAMQLLVPLVPDDNVELLTLRLESVLVHQLLNEEADAEQQFVRAEAALTRHAPEAGDALAVLWSRALVGMALQRHQPDVALAAAQQLVAWAAATAPASAARIEAQLRLGLVHAQGDNEAGLDAVLAALTGPGLGGSPASVAAATRLLLAAADVAFDAGRAARAEALLGSALALLPKAPQQHQLQLALVHKMQATLYGQTGRLDQAAASYVAGRTALVAAVGADHPESLTLAVDAAANDIRRCDFAAAIGSLEHVATYARSRATRRALARFDTTLAEALLRAGRPADAQRALHATVSSADMAADLRPDVRGTVLLAHAMQDMATLALGTDASHAGKLLAAVQTRVQAVQALGMQPGGGGLSYVRAWLANNGRDPACLRHGSALAQAAEMSPSPSPSRSPR